MSKPTINVFDTGAGAYVVCTSFLQIKWHEQIRPTHNMSLKSVSNNPMNIIGKVILLVQLADVHVHVHLSVVAPLAVSLLIGTSFIVWFIKRMFHMKRRVFQLLPGPVAIASEYTPRQTRGLG